VRREGREREKNKAFFSAHIFLRRPHDLNAWNRLDCCGRGTFLAAEPQGIFASGTWLCRQKTTALAANPASDAGCYPSDK